MTADWARIAEALERIAAAVEAWGPAVETEPIRCEHPKDLVEDRSTMGRVEWFCRGCGHRETGEA